MTHQAFFTFHGALQDFFPPVRRQRLLTYAFKGIPSVKDAMEAQGVPHPEVGNLLLNGQQVLFSALLLAGAQVDVWPVVPEDGEKPLPPLQVPAPPERRFVIDVHAGALARYLRLLGFDSLYQNTFQDQAILQVAQQQERIVLTRDLGLLKQRQITRGHWLRSQHWQEQLREVIVRYGLKESIRPFSRCMVCNGLLHEVPKREVMEQLPPKTKQYFQTFFQCGHCQKVYWKGSHYDKMQEFLRQFFG